MTRVLVVDDKPENLYLLRSLLQGHGWEVEEARHGAEALIMARQAPPQLVISDLLMPVMDGYTLLRRWKADERLKAIPFVVYTATYTEPKDEQLALEMGADAFILKPAEPAPFMARIGEVLAKAGRGELSPAQVPVGEEKDLLKEYSEALVRKLEDKALHLEQANRDLLEDVARREKAEAERDQLLEETERARKALLSILEDQRAAEDALRESEAGLRQAQQLAKLGYAITRSDSAIERPSDTLAQLISVAPAQVPKSVREWLTLLHPEDRAMFRDKTIEAGKTGMRWDIEYRLRRGDGAWVVFRHVIEPLPGGVDEAGGTTRWFNMVQDITERKRAENELRAAHGRLQGLSARLLQVQEEERAAIARELHDEIGQSLTALKLGAQALARGLEGAKAKKLADLVSIADRTLAQTRNLALDLRPPQLDHLGLAATLRDCCERVAAGAGLKTAFSADRDYRALDRQLATAAFRVAQEALTNVARHAGARKVAVELRMQDDELLLAVSDDGRGYDLAEARARALKGGSMGILGMEERVALAGGQLRIVTRPGQGTRVQATFPLAPLAPARPAA